MKLQNAFWLLLSLIVLIFLPHTQGTYGTYILTSWMVFSIAAMGLNLTLGYAGQISMAQAAFMGIGAYITALMTMNGVHWIVAMPVSVVVCFVVGLLLGYPALRVQHHFLAFVTLAFTTLVYLVLRNEEWLTGGIYGLVNIPRPSFFDLRTMPPKNFYYFTLCIFVLSGAVMWGIVRSPWGRAFKALRENPVRANSLGVDTRRMTLLAFAIGSAFGGIAGSLQAPLVQYIDPQSFTLLISLKVLLMVVVGGSGYFFGPLLGAALVIILPEYLRFTEGLYLMIYATVVIVLMVFCPTGFVGLFYKIRAKFTEKRVARADLKQGAQL